MFLSVDATLIVQVVNFIVFLLVLNVVFTRPVGAAIAKRRAYINGLSADTEQAEADLKALHAQAEGKRAAARTKEADIVAALSRTLLERALDPGAAA